MVAYSKWPLNTRGRMSKFDCICIFLIEQLQMGKQTDKSLLATCTFVDQFWGLRAANRKYNCSSKFHLRQDVFTHL